ncbi:ankyrin repeat domain-containing protein [Endozoicomonas sp. SCSIO W0465]|uniref:ankyrin repeat domain-containing protein n=1 Tax=Endozoicomonas sp. SCSIO W0465 TaxID=2918516 RepID=UPI0020752E82|nr:ankyrin repeat domain-containing protein [Endozoicomonas sp. SCSIO W0465]USE34911.1 ankyrin repeat domain-containing protein [Endozoicomonas sp. SCSIO W0465]
MNVTSQIQPHIPASPVQETKHEGVEAIPAKEPSCSETAKVFPKLTDTRTLVETAKTVAGQLKDPDGELNDWDFPCNLTPLHIASLAGDMELLRLAIADDFCREYIDQQTSATADGATANDDGASATEATAIEATANVASASPKGNNEVGDQQPIATNHDTALHFALLTGWDKGALALIEELDVQDKMKNTINDKGESLFSLAASHSSLEVVRELCSHFEASENYREYLFHTSEHQRTLLHCAVDQDVPEVFNYLQERQMSATREMIAGSANDQDNQLRMLPRTTMADKDSNGKTPEDLAAIKVGLLYVQQLHDNPKLVEQVRFSDSSNPWQRYYLQNITGLMEPISWIPPWQQCTLV